MTTAIESFEVRHLACAQQLPALRGAWNELAGDVPFRSFDWLEGWWRAYGVRARNKLCVAAVFDADGRLVGLAPWYEERLGQRRVVRFLGSGEVCSDYLTVLCRGGYEDEVTLALADWLCDATSADGRPRFDRLELGGVEQRDTAVLRLVEHLAARGMLVHRRAHQSCWRIRLPARWDDYLVTLSRSHRKQIRRLERKYLESGRMRLYFAASEAQLDRALELLARLHQQRRESLGDRGCFASVRFTAFHAEMARRLLQSGHLRLAWIEIDGRPAAAEYQVLGGHVVYAYQSGIDPQALAHEPGRLITLATLRLAIEEGRTAFDFLRGDELYKAHWRAKPRPTQDILVMPDTPTARLRQNLWRAGDNLKSWLKTGLARGIVGCRSSHAVLGFHRHYFPLM